MRCVGSLANYAGLIKVAASPGAQETPKSIGGPEIENRPNLVNRFRIRGTPNCGVFLSVSGVAANNSPPLGVKQLTDGCCQVLAGDRLLDQADTRIQTPLMNDGIPGIPGHEQDLHVGLALHGCLGQFASVHAGHHDVG
jgi:hypothetical protein